MERHLPRATLAGEREDARVVGVHDRPVLLGLVAEDACLGPRVILEARMAVEVVGREVEEHGHAGMEGLGAFELEARDLEDEDGLARRPLHEAGHRGADVAAHAHVLARLLQHRAQRRRRRRLALGAGDRGHRAREAPEAQLQLRDHFDAGLSCGHQLGQIPRHARRHDDEAGARQRRRVVPAQRQPRALLLQCRHLRRKLRRRLAIGGHHPRPAPEEKLRRRHPRPRHPENHRALALQLHGLLTSA